MTRARDLADLIVHDHDNALTYVKTNVTASAGQTTVTGLTYTAGLINVYLNGVKLVVGVDVTATSGSSIILAAGASANDIIQTVAFNPAEAFNQHIIRADGGSATSVYTAAQVINGGDANG